VTPTARPRRRHRLRLAQRGHVVGGRLRPGRHHLDRGSHAGPIQGVGELVGEHVPVAGTRRDLDQDDRVRQRAGGRTGRGQPVGEQHPAAAQQPGRQAAHGGDHVRGRSRVEPVRGAAVGARRGEGPVEVELGAHGPGDLDQCRSGGGRQLGPVGHQRRADHLERVLGLPDRNQLAGPGQQVVVHPAGQVEQQIVDRLRRRFVHPGPLDVRSGSDRNR
jgi:hypothetical protein